jgi:hypothetical protein
MRCVRALGLVGCLVGSSSGCGSQGSGGDAGDLDASFEASAPSGPCEAVTQQHPIEGFNHVTPCSYVDYKTKPPSSGDHYPIWTEYMTYDQPVPEGYWVHNLEHGAIVLSYNCGDAGCASDVAAAQQMIDQYPDDPECTPDGLPHRLVMTPDPRLDVRFAASAWGWTLRAKCFDADAFLAFAKAHYGNGRELICSDGEDVLVADGADPAGCGTDQ